MRHKDQVFHNFREVKPSVENHKLKKIKPLCLDNGHDYNSIIIKLLSYGQGEQIYCWHCQSLIYDVDFPMCLWTEEWSTTMFIFNICTNMILKGKTQKEGSTDQEPNVSHFWVYCRLVLDEKGIKLGALTIYDGFVGYNEAFDIYSIHIRVYGENMVRRPANS